MMLSNKLKIADKKMFQYDQTSLDEFRDLSILSLTNSHCGLIYFKNSAKELA